MVLKYVLQLVGKALTALTVMLTSYVMGRRAAKKKIERDSAREEVKALKEARETKREVDSLSDDDVRERLRRDYRD